MTAQTEKLYGPIAQRVEAIAETIWDMASKVWIFAELGMEETQSSSYESAVLEKYGFAISDRGIGGIDTSWIATPWDGRSALQAAQLFLHGVDMMREHILPTARMHYIITEGGNAVNVVPDYAKVVFRYRGHDAADVLKNITWVKDIAKGAALATLTNVEMTNLDAAYDCRPNQTLADRMLAHIHRLGPCEWSDEEQAFARTMQKRGRRTRRRTGHNHFTKELLAKYRKEDPGGFMMMHHMRMEDVDAAMQHEGVIVGSDAMGFADVNGKNLEWDDAPERGVAHPRGAGCFAKTLRLVRERNYMPLMTAISKMTYLTASWLEDFVPAMKQLGRLKPGAIADITVFNPDTVTDNAEPVTGKMALPSTGIPYVIVNGAIVVKDSEVLKVYPGRAIKGANGYWSGESRE